jgi:hypothetical protein
MASLADLEDFMNNAKARGLAATADAGTLFAFPKLLPPRRFSRLAVSDRNARP